MSASEKFKQVAHRDAGSMVSDAAGVPKGNVPGYICNRGSLRNETLRRITLNTLGMTINALGMTLPTPLY